MSVATKENEIPRDIAMILNSVFKYINTKKYCQIFFNKLIYYTKNVPVQENKISIFEVNLRKVEHKSKWSFLYDYIH